MARLLDRPVLDTSARKDPPPPRLFTIPLRDLVLLWRLVWRIAVRQPSALWPFAKVVCVCARHNPRAIDYVGMLAALYLHLKPFSRFVISEVDRHIAEIDTGMWRPPLLAAPGEPGEPRDLPQTEAA